MSKIAEAMALAETKFSDYYFNFGRGRCSQDEPLYGFCLYAPDYSSADGPPLISAEHDDPMECIRMAIEKFGTLPPAKQK